MLFALSGKVLPRVTDTILVAERFRVRAMGASRAVGGGDPARVSALLSGKDGTGAPLKGHRHAYYLPLDRDGDGHIDHVLVRCADGLDTAEQAALGSVQSLWQSKGRPDVQVVLVASGAAPEVLDSSRIWGSATPFVTARHHRPARGPIDAWLESELRRAISQHGLPEPLRVEPVATGREGTAGRTLRWLEFRRGRKDDSPRPGHGFRIEFAQEVTGPFALGYASHFGLGLFAPAPSE